MYIHARVKYYGVDMSDEKIQYIIFNRCVTSTDYRVIEDCTFVVVQLFKQCHVHAIVLVRFNRFSLEIHKNNKRA